MRHRHTAAAASLSACFLLLCPPGPISRGDDVPVKGLPAWFDKLDTDGDDQVSLAEWRAGGRSLAEFRKYDLNRDGFITQREASQASRFDSRLKFVRGVISFKGKLEMAEVGYHGKRAYSAYTVQFEKGRAYRIQMVGKALHPLVVVEGPDGKIVAGHFGPGVGQPARFVYRPAVSGDFRVVVTSQDGMKPAEFALTIRELSHTDTMPGLPEWFTKLDTDRDGQVSLAEWRAGGRSLAEARKYDLDRDGFISPREAIQVAELDSRLKFVRGLSSIKGKVEQSDGAVYQGRRAFTVYKVELEKGRKYRIEMVSPVYYAYLFLEGPDGKVLAQHDSGGNGLTSLIVHKAKVSGVYRVIATSLGGFRTGEFTLTMRERPAR